MPTLEDDLQARPGDRGGAARRVRPADAGGSGSLPCQVPQDGERPARVLPRLGVPVLQRRDGGEGRLGPPRRGPHLDPRRPARGELRHLPQLRRSADLRHQRLRRGLPRPLHLGPAAIRRQPRPGGVAEGAARGRHPQADQPLRPLLPRPDQPLHRDRRRRGLRDPARHGARPGADRARGGPVDASRRPARRRDRAGRVRPTLRRGRPAPVASRAPSAPASRPRSPTTSRRSRSPSASTGSCSTSCATSSGSPGSGSAAPGCRRTTSSSRATARRSTTTWS